MPAEENRAIDGELVRRILAGRTAAYEELVCRWSPHVLAICYARVGCGHAAEDLAQETLLRGLSALATLADPEKFGSWLRGIAHRVCLDWLKSKNNRHVSFARLADGQSGDKVVPAASSGTTDALDRQERTAEMMRAVESLPDEQREVIMLYYFRDVTYRDLADLLGVSAATVNVRLTKARASLRRRLKRSEARQ